MPPERVRASTSRRQLGAVGLSLLLPFVIFVTPSDLWRWSIPFIVAIAWWIHASVPSFAGHALFWGGFGLGVAAGVPWPLSIVLPLVALFLLRGRISNLREVTTWARWGRFDRSVAVLSVAITLASSAALVLWFVFADGVLSGVVTMIPADVGPGAFLAGALLFSIANAVWEEFLIKGMMWDALSRLLHRPITLNLVQAFFFGFLHYHGFPSGLSGMLLAGAYGFLLGLVRQRSQGMFAVVLTHFFADLTICGLMYSVVAA